MLYIIYLHNSLWGIFVGISSDICGFYLLRYDSTGFVEAMPSLRTGRQQHACGRIQGSDGQSVRASLSPHLLTYPGACGSWRDRHLCRILCCPGHSGGPSPDRDGPMGLCLDFWATTPPGSQPCPCRTTPREQAASDGRARCSGDLSGLGEP